MSNLRTHLQDLVDTAEWSWLAEHAEQGRLFIVGTNLNLVDVGLALAEDDTSTVKQWLDDGWLHRPTTDQINLWNAHQEQKFESLIIQPFVLAKTPI